MQIAQIVSMVKDVDGDSFIPGGPAFYCNFLSNWGFKVDIYALGGCDLESKFDDKFTLNGNIIFFPGMQSMTFNNIQGETPDQRTQYIAYADNKLSVDNLDILRQINYDVIFIATLFNDNITSIEMSEIRKKYPDAVIAGNPQGSIRYKGVVQHEEGFKVYQRHNPDLLLQLAQMDICSLDEQETFIATNKNNCDYAAQIILNKMNGGTFMLTRGSKGLEIYRKDRHVHIDAVHQKNPVSYIGLGETTISAYTAFYIMLQKLGYHQDDIPEPCGFLAALSASLKIANQGVLKKSMTNVLDEAIQRRSSDTSFIAACQDLREYATNSGYV